MKKKFTLFALTCAFAAGASSQNEIVSTINSFNYEAGQSKPKNPNTIKRYFYDENNNNIAELNINNFENTKTDKVYNADGTLNTTFEYNKANKYTTFELTRKSIYTYDSNKKVTEIAIYDQNSDAPTGYMEYTYEAASENYIVRTLNADKSHASSTSKYEYGFNNDGKISFEIIRILNWSGTEYTPQQKTTYEYEEGKLISESVFARGWSGEEFQTTPKSIQTYTYENNLLVSDKKTEGEFIYENTYIYSNYSKDKNILNIKAEKVNSVDAAPNTVKLTWDAVNGVDGYSVYVDNVHTSVSSNECTLELLANGEHKAYIVAVNDGKDAGYVGISEFSVKNEDMPKVSNIYVISCSKIEGPYSYTYEVKIGWDIPQSSTGILGYNTNCHNSKDMTTENIFEKIFYPYAVEDNINGEIVGKDLSFSVNVIYETGVSEESDIFTFNPVLISTGINETTTNSTNISVYPNPFVNTLNFSEEVKAEIFSLDGATILKSNDFTNSLDVNHLSNGSYIIKMTTSNGSVNSQVIIKK